MPSCKECAAPADDGLIFCKQCGATLQAVAPLTQSRDQLVSGVPQARPWVRYWARMFDINLFAVAAGFFLGIFVPRAVPRGMTDTIVMNVLLLFLWIFVESLLLSWLGTTPGKALLKTRLRLTSNPTIPYSMALKRSLKVWWRGLAAGIPVVNIFTLVNADNRLTEDSITSWDQEDGFVVAHEKIGTIRLLVAVISFMVFAALFIVGTVDPIAR